MIKRPFIKVTLRRGESLNRENFTGRTCLLVMQGSFMVFNKKGEVVFRLNAGEANVMSEYHELTGTAVEDDTRIIIA